jgi:hypothetical protein
MFIVLFGALFFASGDIGFSNIFIMTPFALLFIFLFIYVVFTATAQTIISNDEISTKNLLGTKTLKWSEINRVSGRGHRIKLHNFDGDVTISPSAQLPGYLEVVDWIGVKRPDLFNPLEYSEMSKSWAGTLLLPVLGFLFLGVGFFLFTQDNELFFPLLIFFVMGLVFIGTPLFSPQSVSIEGNSIVIKYIFSQKTLSADEIASIGMSFTQTRNGKNYFIIINLVNRRNIRVSGLSPNLPVASLVLKNWHKKNRPLA